MDEGHSRLWGKLGRIWKSGPQEAGSSGIGALAVGFIYIHSSRWGYQAHSFPITPIKPSSQSGFSYSTLLKDFFFSPQSCLPSKYNTRVTADRCHYFKPTLIWILEIHHLSWPRILRASDLLSGSPWQEHRKPLDTETRLCTVFASDKVGFTPDLSLLWGTSCVVSTSHTPQSGRGSIPKYRKVCNVGTSYTK